MGCRAREHWAIRLSPAPTEAPAPRYRVVPNRSGLAAGVGANLTTDSHAAALAMEYQAEVHSNDTDFSRFPGLRWRNPL